MRLIIEQNYEQLSKWAANYVAAKIKQANPTPEKPFVLGLPTGSSPLGMYKNLIELNKKGVISFQNVITFNMDEYVGLPKDHPESYHSFMWNNFFSHIDIKPENVNILNGNAEDIEESTHTTDTSDLGSTDTFEASEELMLIIRGIAMKLGVIEYDDSNILARSDIKQAQKYVGNLSAETVRQALIGAIRYAESREDLTAITRTLELFTEYLRENGLNR